MTIPNKLSFSNFKPLECAGIDVEYKSSLLSIGTTKISTCDSNLNIVIHTCENLIVRLSNDEIHCKADGTIVGHNVYGSVPNISTLYAPNITATGAVSISNLTATTVNATSAALYKCASIVCDTVGTTEFEIYGLIDVGARIDVNTTVYGLDGSVVNASGVTKNGSNLAIFAPFTIDNEPDTIPMKLYQCGLTVQDLPGGPTRIVNVAGLPYPP